MGVAGWRCGWKTLALMTWSENCEGGSDLCSGESGTDDLQITNLCRNFFFFFNSVANIWIRRTNGSVPVLVNWLQELKQNQSDL